MPLQQAVLHKRFPPQPPCHPRVGGPLLGGAAPNASGASVDRELVNVARRRVHPSVLGEKIAPASDECGPPATTSSSSVALALHHSPGWWSRDPLVGGAGAECRLAGRPVCPVPWARGARWNRTTDLSIISAETAKLVTSAFGRRASSTGISPSPLVTFVDLCGPSLVVQPWCKLVWGSTADRDSRRPQLWPPPTRGSTRIAPGPAALAKWEKVVSRVGRHGARAHPAVCHDRGP